MGFLIREKENTNVTGEIRKHPGNSQKIQWLRLCASTARGTGLIPGRTTEIPYAVQCSQKKEIKKCPVVLFENVI